ncbi:hypothetical protein ACG3SL_09490 [Sphingomonas sp. CJ20]
MAVGQHKFRHPGAGRDPFSDPLREKAQAEHRMDPDFRQDDGVFFMPSRGAEARRL